jgi:hypothetical protein
MAVRDGLNNPSSSVCKQARFDEIYKVARLLYRVFAYSGRNVCLPSNLDRQYLTIQEPLIGGLILAMFVRHSESLSPGILALCKMISSEVENGRVINIEYVPLICHLNWQGGLGRRSLSSHLFERERQRRGRPGRDCKDVRSPVLH